MLFFFLIWDALKETFCFIFYFIFGVFLRNINHSLIFRPILLLSISLFLYFILFSNQSVPINSFFVSVITFLLLVWLCLPSFLTIDQPICFFVWREWRGRGRRNWRERLRKRKLLKRKRMLTVTRYGPSASLLQKYMEPYVIIWCSVSKIFPVLRFSELLTHPADAISDSVIFCFF